MRPNTQVQMKALDASADKVGATIDANQVLTISAQAIVTGTSTGTLNIQASNDPPSGLANVEGVPTVVNWTNIATIGTIAIAGAGTYLIPKFDVAYRWIRCSFVHNNGAAGTITVNVQTQGQ